MERTRKQKSLKRFRLENNPPLFFLLSYASVIVVGTGLLTGPWATQSGEMTSPIDALFTATSALCVTGLSPVVSAEHWNIAGQLILLVLIQLGGLGIMTAAAAFGMVARRKITLLDRRVLMEEKGQSGIKGMVRLVRFILLSTFAIEAIGAVLLALSFVPQFGILKGVWLSVFHSVSAFCNAGFDLLGPASLSAYTGNVLVCLTISFLVIVAGIGYTVYMEVLDRRRLYRLSLHSKIVLTVTGALLALGTLGFLLLEYNNPATLGGLHAPGEKVLAAFFQSVTTRTAGFFSIDQAALRTPSAVLTIVLMFIGGSPTGTAGGIKTTTVMAIILATIGEIRSDAERPIFHRNLARFVFRKAFAIFVIALSWCLLIGFLLCCTEPNASFLDVMFETVSGFGTVGLTRNLTPSLSAAGKLLISLDMLFGKIGPLTMMYAVTKKKFPAKFREAEENVFIG
ncbi:MAG: TrkH family potassium uptake protein [Ndongobacter sp.]|nr:TrkH family potassium uptake protein [Ndongobacter sp.]